MGWVADFQRADQNVIPASVVRHPRSPNASFTADDLGLPERMDGDGPCVSVVVTTYEDSHYLPDALECVGAQTHGNLELLIVDSSGIRWVERLADQREWVQYLFQEPQGLSAARNEGIERARGEYVALLDADDYWHPEKIERQVEALETRSGNVSYCGHYMIDIRTSSEQAVTYRDLTSPRSVYVDLIDGGVISIPSTVVFRRTWAQTRPFDESLDACEDFVLFAGWYSREEPVHIPELHCVYRRHAESMSNDDDRIASARIEAIPAIESAYPDLKPYLDRQRARRAIRQALAALEEGNETTARRRLKLSLRLNPVDYRAWVILVASLIPGDGTTAATCLRTAHNVVGSVIGSSGSDRVSVVSTAISDSEQAPGVGTNG